MPSLGLRAPAFLAALHPSYKELKPLYVTSRWDDWTGSKLGGHVDDHPCSLDAEFRLETRSPSVQTVLYLLLQNTNNIVVIKQHETIREQCKSYDITKI